VVRPATKTKEFALTIEEGDPSWLRDARYTSRDVFNRSIELKDRGLSRSEIQRRVTPDDYLANNKCAVVGKALATWGSYQELRSQWLSLDNPHEHPEPGAPNTDKNSAFPLVMAHGEGYRLTVRDDGRVGFRISAKPYKKVGGFLRGEHTDLSLLRDAIEDSEEQYSFGQAEVLWREGVYYLHVPVQYDADVPDETDAETVVGVDINERNVALTALNRETLATRGTLVLDYGPVKGERQRLHDISRRCQEAGKDSIYRTIGDYEERYVNWVLHRLSRAIIAFAQQFDAPTIVFEDMSGIRDGMDYGTFMNRRLHRLPFRKLQDQVEYKAKWDEIPTFEVDAYYNSQTCSCCGEHGSRRKERFTCRNDDCSLNQDHADRNASVNVAWRGVRRISSDDSSDDNYRTRKTQPEVRLVRLCGSGRRVNRPTSSASIAECGVLS
jgi:putative transposase